MLFAFITFRLLTVLLLWSQHAKYEKIKKSIMIISSITKTDRLVEIEEFKHTN